ncbi:MAG: TetR/AcrR family transcriptional regulator [Thermomicrobiales bacterium]
MAGDAKSPLTVERIVAMAIAIADNEGLEAASMRRVAAELRSGVMSLYRHVANHEDLVHRMCDRLAIQYGYRDHGISSWRNGLIEMSQRDWEMYIDHPWILPITVASGPYLGPNTLANYEWACRQMEATGLPLIEQHQIIMAVSGFVAGMAIFENNSRRASLQPGLAPEEWAAQERGSLARHTDLERYPLFSRVLLHPDATNFEKFFDFGLRSLLDGVEARVRGSDLE